MPDFTEEECFKKLVKVKLESGSTCPGCGGGEFWSRSSRRLIVCKNCRKELSPLSETMFSRSHLTLEQWFMMIYLVTCSPDRVITARTVCSELMLGSYRTAWETLNKIRYSISINEPRRRLGGLIEFDEMVISGNGSDYQKLSILGALELEGEKRLSLQMVKNPDEMNIKVYLKKKFENDVVVITDPEKLYIRNWLELNRLKQKSAVDYYGTNFMNLHILFQDIRFGLRNGHHSVSEKYLQRNLDEYVFVFNHNDNRKNAFEIVLNYMVNTKINDYLRVKSKKRSVLSIIRG